MDNILISNNNGVSISPTPPVQISTDSNLFVNQNMIDSGSGATIQIGTVETLPAGSNAYVRNVGTDRNAIFDMGIPQGANGTDGLDGQDGDAATITVNSTTTTESGTDAEVVNIGTTSAALLDFYIPQGADGFSPTASVEQTVSGATITITDQNGTTTANIENGQNGVDGNDGFSPTATVTQLTNGAQIDITSANGSSTATVYNGTDGAAGYSPIATVTQNTGSATISITDLNGTTTATVYDGTDGINGTNGTDGFSPIATVTQNTGSATISITDLNGTTTATVYDGTAASLDWADIQNKPNFATVATSGSYNDLLNKPTIPTVNDATLTIQKNGTNIETFTANSSTNKTANITVPTQFSELGGTVDTTQIADNSINSAKLKGYSTTNTTDTWIPVTTGTGEIQHRIIKPFSADGSVPASAIDWTTIQTVNMTRETADITWDGNTYCKRFGNIVVININIATGNTISGSTALYSGLPIPSQTVACSLAGSDNNVYRFTIANDGKMYSDGNIAGGTWFNGQCVYFV